MGKDKCFQYKEYYGSVEFDLEDRSLYGRIQFIADLVTYEAETLESLEKEFRNAVDDYVETCAQVGKDPQKPMSGTFNVRIGPDLHKRLSIRAMKDGVSINELVKTAVEQFTGPRQSQYHNHYYTLVNEVISVPTFEQSFNIDLPRIGRH